MTSIQVLGLEDVRELVEQQCMQRDLLLVPGSACMCDATRPCPYIRVSYSMITPEMMDKVSTQSIRLCLSVSLFLSIFTNVDANKFFSLER